MKVPHKPHGFPAPSSLHTHYIVILFSNEGIQTFQQSKKVPIALTYRKKEWSLLFIEFGENPRQPGGWSWESKYFGILLFPAVVAASGCWWWDGRVGWGERPDWLGVLTVALLCSPACCKTSSRLPTFAGTETLESWTLAGTGGDSQFLMTDNCFIGF